MADLPPGNFTELFLYVSSTFPYLPGPVMKALDPSCSAPKFARKQITSINISAYKSPKKTSMCYLSGMRLGGCGEVWGILLGDVGGCVRDMFGRFGDGF